MHGGCNAQFKVDSLTILGLMHQCAMNIGRSLDLCHKYGETAVQMTFPSSVVR